MEKHGNSDNIKFFSEVASSIPGDSVVPSIPSTLPSTTKEYHEEVLTFPDYGDDGFEFNQHAPIIGSELMEQIDKFLLDNKHLEEKKRMLIEEAESVDPGKTAMVLLNSYMSRMIVTLETNKQLENLKNRTLDEEYPNSDLLKMKRKSPRNLPHQSKRYEPPSGDSSGYSTQQSSLVPIETDSKPFIDKTLAQQIVSTFHQQIRGYKTEDDRLRVGTEESVQYAFRIAQTFPDNEQIQGGFCGFLNAVAMTGKQGLSNILCIYEESLKYLNSVYNKHWKDRRQKTKLYTDIIGLLFQFSHSASTVKNLLQDKYIELLLRPFKTDEFSNIDVLCGISLLNLMQFNGGQEWNLKKSTVETETTMLKGLKQWELGKLYPIAFNRASFINKLNEVNNPSLLVRQLNLWLIANATKTNNKDKEKEQRENCKILSNNDGVRLLKEVLKQEDCTPEMVASVNFALANLKKKKWYSL